MQYVIMSGEIVVEGSEWEKERQQEFKIQAY